MNRDGPVGAPKMAVPNETEPLAMTPVASERTIHRASRLLSADGSPTTSPARPSTSPGAVAPSADAAGRRPRGLQKDGPAAPRRLGLGPGMSPGTQDGPADGSLASHP